MKDALRKGAARFKSVRLSRRGVIAIVSILLCLPLLYAVLGFLAVPSYIQSRAESIAREQLKRELVIDRLSFNPFTFVLDVQGLRLSEHASEARFVSFDRLVVKVLPSSVLRLTPVVTELTLSRPFISVYNEADGTRNFDDIVALFQKDDDDDDDEEVAQAQQEAASAKPLTAEVRRAERRKRRFGIYNVRIEDARIELEDRAKQSRTVIENFNFGLPYLYRGPIRGIERHVEPQFEALINGKKLEILREVPDESSRDRILKLQMDNIDLKRIFQFVPLHRAFKFREGFLDLNLAMTVHRPRGGLTRMDFSGEINLREISLTQRDRPILDIERLRLVLGTNSPASGDFAIDKLELIRPEIHAVRGRRGRLNFVRMLSKAKDIPPPDSGINEGGFISTKGEGEPAPVKVLAAKEAEPKGMRFALKELVVRKGRFTYTDRAEAAPVEATIRHVELGIENLLLDTEKRTVQVGRIHSPSSAIDITISKAKAVTVQPVPASPDPAVKGEKEDRGPGGYVLSLGALDVANWSVKLKNSHRGEFASLPVSAALSKFGIALKEVELDTARLAAKVASIQSNGGQFDVVMHSQAGASAKTAAAANASPAESASLTVSVGKVGVNNWSGKFRQTSDNRSATLPMTAVISRLGLNVEGVEADLGAGKVGVSSVQSSGVGVDLTLEDHPGGNMAPDTAGDTSAMAFAISRAAIANWSLKLKNNNKGDLAELPALIQLSQVGMEVSEIEADMGRQVFTVGSLRSAKGHFDVLMENVPPKVPVARVARAAANPMQVKVGKVELVNWSGKLKNTDRLDRFQLPFSAALSKLGVTLSQIHVNLNDQAVTVDSVATRGGHADVELMPYKKPASSGKRAAERAALLASVIAAKKAQPAGGMTIRLGKASVADWSARVKNANKTDRAGPPVTGRASKIELMLSDAVIDTKKRDIRIGEISSRSLDAMGQLEKHEKAERKAREAGRTPVVMPGDDPFTIHIGKAAIEGWAVRGRNLNMKNPLGVAITGLSLSGQNISSQAGDSSQFTIRATVDKSGQLAAQGSLGLSPLKADVSLNLKEVSIVAIQPYIEDVVNLTLNRGNLSLTGQLNLEEDREGQVSGSFRGDMTLARFSTLDQINKDAFIRWRNLELRDMEARFMPLTVRVKEAELDNFFARVILNADGRLNLSNILRSETGEQTSLTESDSELDELAEGEGKKSAIRREGKAVAGMVKPAAAPKKADAPLVFIEKMMLKKGRVRFTDNFIKPNYTANISELGGVVSGLSSDPEAVARLDLQGEVNNAPLTVAGSISPLKEQLSLDVKAHVRGMELAQFSSYTTKYIGYGIAKGKLSFDVEYKLEDGVLVADNRLVLDQLTFGEKAPGEPVTSLPVELAVSLLKDSNGVIDINLPIGGSLDDPEFSIGGIIARVFLSSLKRVILAPFSFLSIKFGGGAELSFLEFEPGSAAIPVKEMPKLEALSKALTEQKELKLDVTGLYDPVADKEGLARAAIDRNVRMLKRRDLQEKGQTVAMNQLRIEENEYPDLLERVYKDEKFKKPRNLIGLQKKLSVPEMEQLMIRYYPVTEEEYLALAYKRAEKVKEWLVETGRIPDSRIFILASRAGDSGENGESAARVDFALQ